MTFSEFLESLLDCEKKQRLIEDIKWIGEQDELVEICIGVRLISKTDFPPLQL